MSAFSIPSQRAWLRKKTKSFQQAIAHQQSLEGSVVDVAPFLPSLKEFSELLMSEEILKNLETTPTLQDAFILLLVSLSVALRFQLLETLGKASLPLVASLMDETLLRSCPDEALFFYESIKRVYALKKVLEMFDPEQLDFLIQLYEEVAHEQAA